MKPFAQYVKADTLVETAVEGDPAPGYTVCLRFSRQGLVGKLDLDDDFEAFSSYCSVMLPPICAVRLVDRPLALDASITYLTHA
jgi:hypothetical protein